MAGEAQNLFEPRFNVLLRNHGDPTKWPWQPTYDAAGIIVSTPVNSLFTELNALYATIDLSKTTSLDFDKLYMKNKTYPQFLAEFQNLSNLCNKTDAQKVDELKRRISTELRDALRS